MKRLITVIMLSLSLSSCKSEKIVITEEKVKQACEMLALNEFNVYSKEELNKVFSDEITKEFLSLYMPVFQEQGIQITQEENIPKVNISNISINEDKAYIWYTYDFMPEDENVMILSFECDKVSSYKINPKEEGDSE